jgi:hypothetical protein
MQWARLKAVQAAFAGDPRVTVSVRIHMAELSCSCPDSSWLAVRAMLRLEDLDLTVQRQYELDE